MVSERWKKNRFVKRPISFSSAGRDERGDDADDDGERGDRQDARASP